MKKLLLIFFLALSSFAVAQIPVAHCVIMDWSGCSVGTPNNSCALASVFGATPTTNNFNSTTNLSIATSAQHNPWIGVTPSCVTGWSNNSTVGMVFTIPSGSAGNTLTQLFSSGSSNTTTVSSLAVPWMTDVPQNAPQNSGQYYDTFDISTNGGFVNFQWFNAFQTNKLDWFFECGGCTQNAAPNRLLPSNTWWIVNEYAGGATTYGACSASPCRYIGMWDGTTGLYIANTLAVGTSASAQSILGYYVGAGVGSALPTGDHVSFGTVMQCGIDSSQTVCPFPLPPGLQRLAPTLSLAGGSYSTPQSGITMADVDGLGSIYYTLDGSTPSCTLGANDVITGTTGTLYTGAITVYITTTVNAIDCKSNYQNSTVTTVTYKITAGASVLAPARAIDWTNVGAVPGQPGYIPDAAWTQSGSTISAYGSFGTPGNTSTINTALSSCTAGQYVLLGAGNFYLTGNAITVPSNCELRGSGANSTFLLYFSSGSGSNAGQYFISLQGSNNFANGEQNHATWTAGFSQAATSLTLSNTLNIVAGKTIIAIDQQDETADPGKMWNCVAAPCGAANSSGAPRTDNTCAVGVSPFNGHCSQVQYVLVTACGTCNSGSSSTVTISPGLAMPNWASAKSTGAWWATTVAQQPGVRDLSIDMTNATSGTSPIAINNAYEAFVYQVRTILGARNHVMVQFSKNATIANSYFFNEQSGFTGTSSYAIELLDTSDTLVTNNICQQVVECAVQTGGGTGDVYAYNFPVSSISNSTAFMTQMDFDHASGDSFFLKEGEIVSGIEHDQTHGTHTFFTDTRNVLEGWAPASSCNGTACTTNTVSDFIYGGSRYGNVVGNLVGQSGYHTVSGTLYYASTTGAQCGNPSWKTIFMIGCGTSSATFLSDPTNTGSSTLVYDPLAISSLMLYDNWDVINASACTTTSGGCTASKASAFNDITGSPSSYIGLSSPGTLPPSFVFAGTPPFFGSIPFPPIGPDVTSGNLLLATSGTYNGSYVTSSSQCGGCTTSSAYGGHANANPAMACYLSNMSGPPDGSGSVLAFNPAVCYTASNQSTTPGASLNGMQVKGIAVN